MLDVNDILKKALELAKIVGDGLEGKKTANQVWMKSSEPSVIGPDGIWFQVNVITNFEYDEVK